MFLLTTVVQKAFSRCLLDSSRAVELGGPTTSKNELIIMVDLSAKDQGITRVDVVLVLFHLLNFLLKRNVSK